MTHLDLFSGIGGFAVAAQWAGFETVGFCEIDERSRSFLEKTWRVFCERDIRCLEGSRYRGVTLLTGGPPCQPSSRAGNQRGADDDRWLWPEALRVLDEAKPDWVVFENPTGILDMDFDGILSQMEGSGYEVQPFAIPACAVDSPQLRERIWIVGSYVADNFGNGRQDEIPLRPKRPRQGATDDSGIGGAMADAERQRRERRAARTGEAQRPFGSTSGLHSNALAHSSKQHRSIIGCEAFKRGWDNAVWVPCADGKFRRAPDESVDVVNGLHRSILGALGNSICPQVAYQILKAIAQTTTHLD